MKLTAKAVAAERFSGKPRKVFDGHGLHLYITARARTWRYAYRFHGKERTYTIGDSELLSLAQARERHRDARMLVLDGVDPVADRQKDRQAEQRAAEEQRQAQTTFGDVITEWQVHKQRTWSVNHAKKVQIRLNALPGWFTSEPITGITQEHITRVLEPILSAGKPHAAHKLADFLRQALDRAVSNEVRPDNPAKHPAVKSLLGKRPTGKNFAFISDTRLLGRLLNDIDYYTGHPSVVAALKLLPLVVTRPGELRGMRWDEVDLQTGVWEIPAERMKSGKAHIVPLSEQALSILQVQIEHSPANCSVVFPGRISGTPISDMTLSNALKRLGYENQIKPHGFRHTFSTLANDQRITDIDGQPMTFRADAIEAQLAHSQRGVRAVYNKAQYFDERVRMMQAYSDWLDRVKSL